MNRFGVLLLAIVLISAVASADIAKGPAKGSIPGGVVVNTRDFPESAGTLNAWKGESAARPRLPVPEADFSVAELGGPEMETSQEAILPGENPGIPSPVTHTSCGWMKEPDLKMNWVWTDIAAGPGHLMIITNTVFQIASKNGTVLKTIDGLAWNKRAAPSITVAYAEEIMYDHVRHRWIMLWAGYKGGDFYRVNYNLISVSDDDNPLGGWKVFALPGTVNGTSGAYNYVYLYSMGYDEQALYLAGTQVRSPGVYDYAKLRIVNLTELYGKTAGPVSWVDFWDIRVPNGMQVSVGGLRPATIHGEFPTDRTDAPEFYLIGRPNTTGMINNVTLYTLRGSILQPVLTAIDLPVTPWRNSTSAPQYTVHAPGEPAAGIDILTDGLWLPQHVIYRNGSLWVATAAWGVGNWTSIRVAQIDPARKRVVGEIDYRQPGQSNYFPTIDVDRNNNVLVAFSRSGPKEFVGLYVAGRRPTDPPGLSTAVAVKGGICCVTHLSNGYNGWLNYSGVAVDPVDDETMWIVGAHAGQDEWCTVLARTHASGQAGQFAAVDRASMGFARVEVGKTGAEQSFSIHNDGTEPMVLVPGGAPDQFDLGGPFDTRVVVPAFGSVQFTVQLAPREGGNFKRMFSLGPKTGLAGESHPTIEVVLAGRGVKITPPEHGMAYGVDAVGKRVLYSVDARNGRGVQVGWTYEPQIRTMTFRPSTRELYGASGQTSKTLLYRISASMGDAILDREIPVSYGTAIAFGPIPIPRGTTSASNSDEGLFVGTIRGELYSYDIKSRVRRPDLVLAAENFGFAGLAIHPRTGVMYASNGFLADRGGIYKVNLGNGQLELVIRMQDGLPVWGLAFDHHGELYGVKDVTRGSLVRIDLRTGEAIPVPQAPALRLGSIAMRTDPIAEETAVSKGTVNLEENYPNPFNPATMIRYSLPAASHVSLTVYNILGQVVATLVDGEMDAGIHEARWDAFNAASGVYVCRLQVGDVVAVRKMMLVK